jgi:acetyl esterase/lipase
LNFHHEGDPMRRLCWGLVLAVCATGTLAAGEAAKPQIATDENVLYREAGGEKLMMDFAYPADTSTKKPAILFIHGGGWRGGNRAAYKNEIRRAAEKGYVAATVSYRLTQADKDGKAKVPFPAQVHDVKAAVRYLRENADKYGIDPDRIGATGGSAGGHLSLMLGVTDADDGLEGLEGGDDENAPSSRVQAVVNVFGPTDMPRLRETSQGAAPIVATFLAGTPETAAEHYRQASPVTFVSKDDPPTLTIHGRDDKLVPPDQAERLDERMRQVGAVHELLLLDKQGHGFTGEANVRASEAMYRFFDEHLKNAGK